MEIEETPNPPNTLDHGRTTVNRYATKKTLALSNLQMALLTTNSFQLKTFLDHKTPRDHFWLIGLILISASLLTQLINTCLLIILGSADIGKEHRQHRLICLNNFSLLLSVFVNVINITLNIIVFIHPELVTQAFNATRSF